MNTVLYNKDMERVGSTTDQICIFQTMTKGPLLSVIMLDEGDEFLFKGTVTPNVQSPSLACLDRSKEPPLLLSFPEAIFPEASPILRFRS